MHPFVASFIDILFWLNAVALAWLAYIVIFNRGTSNIGSAPALQRLICDRLVHHSGTQNQPQKVYDLGSGSGGLSRAVASTFPSAQVVGIEHSRPDLMTAQIFGKVFGYKNLSYRRADIYQSDFSDADAIVMFLTRYHMIQLAPVLRQTLKPGTLVISNRFPLGGDWVPLEEPRAKTLAPNQGQIFVYRH